jgi:hypothetical protein
MPQYMLLFYETPAEAARGDNPAEAPAYWGAWNAYVGAVSASGLMQSGNGLLKASTAMTVRMKGGQRHVQDGPFADTREHLGGYFVLDCTQEQALEWAARAPNSSAGSTEVRPVLPPPADGGPPVA